MLRRCRAPVSPRFPRPGQPDGALHAACAPCRRRSGRRRSEPVAFADLVGWASDDHGAAFGLPRLLPGSRRSAMPALRIGAAAAPELGDACAAALAMAMVAAAHRACPGGQALLRGAFLRLAHRARERARLLHRLLRARGRGLADASGPLRDAGPGRPPDLVTFAAGARRRQASTGLSSARRAAGRHAWRPIRTGPRSRTARSTASASRLLYLADPVDRFFLQVQGSGPGPPRRTGRSSASPMTAATAGPIPPSAASWPTGSASPAPR